MGNYVPKRRTCGMTFDDAMLSRKIRPEIKRDLLELAEAHAGGGELTPESKKLALRDWRKPLNRMDSSAWGWTRGRRSRLGLPEPEDME